MGFRADLDLAVGWTAPPVSGRAGRSGPVAWLAVASAGVVRGAHLAFFLSCGRGDGKVWFSPRTAYLK
jgi:hypothetical protein